MSYLGNFGVAVHATVSKHKFFDKFLFTIKLFWLLMSVILIDIIALAKNIYLIFLEIKKR